MRQNSKVNSLLTIAVVRWCAASIRARISPSSLCGAVKERVAICRNPHWLTQGVSNDCAYATVRSLTPENTSSTRECRTARMLTTPLAKRSVGRRYA